MTRALSSAAGSSWGLAITALTLVGACGPVASIDDAGQPSPWDGSPWASRVVRFTPGDGAGHNEEKLPDVVLGPPKGLGASSGSVSDVLSLGEGGVIVLELGIDVVDGEGTDLVVFENAFRFGSEVFAEPGVVSVSLDGEDWSAFACDAAAPTPNGCAGYAPVLPDEAGDARVAELGGDAFDLADVGLARARFVRVEDAGERRFGDDGMTGFDLDAVGVVNAADGALAERSDRSTQ